VVQFIRSGDTLSVLTFDRFRGAHHELVDRLYRRARADACGLTEEAFAEALYVSVRHRLSSGNPPAVDIERYLESLHHEDLALAWACAAGIEIAWDRFVREFRPKLRSAAAAISGPDTGRDLADSLHAELFGLEERNGIRRSLFRYFHGRSSLGTWLRAVLVQRHVDGVRAGRSTEPLLDDESPSIARVERDPDPDRARYLALLREVLVAVLAKLDARDRLRLSLYYVQDLTLAQIGRILREHEATTSRNLSRVRTSIRTDVDRLLREQHGLADAQVNLCLAYAVEEWPFDLGATLSASPEAQETSG
jgi:RNA polymerase sigma-70 factor (ECF subfamily)